MCLGHSWILTITGCCLLFFGTSFGFFQAFFSGIISSMFYIRISCYEITMTRELGFVRGDFDRDFLAQREMKLPQIDVGGS